MNADSFKHKEITDIILRSFYEVYNEKVTVELKAVCTLNPAHEAQLINYLKATNIEVGLLLNFGKRPEFKRFIYDGFVKSRIHRMCHFDRREKSYFFNRLQNKDFSFHSK